MNTYRVHYDDQDPSNHKALRIDVGAHGTLVMWGSDIGKPRIERIILAWAPGCWTHVELRAAGSKR